MVKDSTIFLLKFGSAYWEAYREIAPHGIAEVYVDGVWRKASAAFNKTLCEKFKVAPLTFDGTADAMIQPFNQEEDQFMEYVEDYGHFADVPLDDILAIFERNYPALFERNRGLERIVVGAFIL